MTRFFVSQTAWEDECGGEVDFESWFRQGVTSHREEIIYPCEALCEDSQFGPYVCRYPRVATRRVYTRLWHLLLFLRRMAGDLYISDQTDWSRWSAERDQCRDGWWLYMPEMPATSLEAIEIYESFGEFPT